VNDWLLTYGSYLLIPFIAGLAGWGTNWLAIKMTFYPLEYVGRFPFWLARGCALPYSQVRLLPGGHHRRSHRRPENASTRAVPA
jgi:hypothetical protein